MSRDIDISDVQHHLVNVYTLGELLAFYKPESAPETRFGNIYTNAGFMIMEHMTAANRALEGEEPTKES